MVEKFVSLDVRTIIVTAICGLLIVLMGVLIYALINKRK